MAYPRTHSLLTIGGDGWNGVEIWQFGVRFDRATVPTAEEAAITAAVTAWWSEYGPTDYVRLTHWKWALQGVDGKYPEGHVPLEHVFAPAVVGNTSNGGAQPQDSIVVSLRTAIPRGRGHAGRIYPPPRPVNVGPDGKLTLPAALLTPFTAMFRAIQDAVDAPMVVGSKLASTLRPVTSLRIGAVVDTQRRRRNNISESYVDEPFPAPAQLVTPGPEATGPGSNDWWIPSNNLERPSPAFKSALPCYVEVLPELTHYAILLRAGDSSIYPACTTDGYHTMHLGGPMSPEAVSAESFPEDWTRYYA